MRRVLVLCAVAVTIFAVIGALRLHRVATVSAASSPSLAPLITTHQEAGCPIGPGLTFCDRIPGTVSPPASFQLTTLNQVTNITTSLAAVPGLAANFATGDFTTTSNTCTGNLAGGKQCSVDIEFSPTTVGLREAALTITDAGGDKITFIMDGTGKNLALAPPAGFYGSRNAFGFPYTPVGGGSTSYPFTVTASSAVTGLNVAFAAIPGLESEFNSSQPDFAIVSTTCGGALGAGASCTAEVAFEPKTAGLRSAALTATDSSGDSTTIYIAGTNNDNLIFLQSFSNPPACLTEQQAGFCAEPQGGSTATNMYTLQNNSGTQITGLAITPPIPTNPPTQPPTDFTVQSTTCTTTLAAGATCAINIAFTPQGTGLRQGAIVATDAQGDIGAINLAGTGDNYQLQLASSQTQELTIEQGTTATWNAQLTADSVFGTRGEQVTLLCPTNLPQYSYCVFNPCPLTSITPNTTTTFTIAITTASKTKPLPAEIPAACAGSTAAAPGMRGPGNVIYLAPQAASRRARFPALALLVASLAIGFTLLGFGSRLRSAWRVPLIFATAGIAAVIVFGCGGGKPTTGITPTGVTTMAATGNALDSSGNPINASRTMQSITLDVVTGK